MTDELLDILKAEAAKLGSDFLRDGIDLVKRNLHGDATQADVIRWIRENQGREPE